jgi:LPXTG-motif cell wall-anchored protein
LYDVVQGFERDDLDIKINIYSNQNRAEAANGTSSGYVVETENYALTWFGALQIIIIGALVGISAYVIYRKKRK